MCCVLSMLGTVCRACKLQHSSRVTPKQQHQQIRSRALTWMAAFQSLGSAVMVKVDTVQPSLALSLWSISMLMKGGVAWAL